MTSKDYMSLSQVSVPCNHRYNLNVITRCKRIYTNSHVTNFKKKSTHVGFLTYQPTYLLLLIIYFPWYTSMLSSCYNSYCRIEHSCLCPGWQFDLGWPCSGPCWRACSFLHLQRLPNYPSLLWNCAMDCHEESSCSHEGSGSANTDFYCFLNFVIKFCHLSLC